MAGKGWSLLLVMLGTFVVVFILGTHVDRTVATIKASPQGSAVILSNGSVNAANDEMSSKLKDAAHFGVSPRPLIDLSAPPIFALPQQEKTDHSEALESLNPTALDCSLYH